MAQQPALLLFTRLPKAGSVKSRLARTVGDGVAADFYRRCVERVLLALEPIEAARRVYVADRSELDLVAEWVGSAWPVRAQSPGDLTRRLQCAFDEAFDEGHASVIVVATDTPDLGAGQIERALAALQEHDAVLGPAADGGYYLLGLRRPNPVVFSEIPWSTDRVADRTREQFERLGLSWAELEPLPDVDTEPDLRRWMRQCEPGDMLAQWVGAQLD